MTIRGTTAVLAVVFAFVPLCAVAFGEGGATLSTATIIQVQATDTDTGQTGQFTQVWPVSAWTGPLSWTLPAPTALDGAGLAFINAMTVNLSADPQVDLTFDITNTTSKNVRLSIATDTIVFDDPVLNAWASASGSLTLNDLGGSVGASLTGLFSGNAYQARYSTDEVLPPAAVFANLLPSTSTLGSTVSWADASPVSGMTNLGTTVYMMESEFHFTLSARDQAIGTSTFLITPEPASAVLLALGSLALWRRRR